MYEIPCYNCKKVYIGETGRLFGTRKKEHHEAERLGTKEFTRATRKDSESKQIKSSIADHVANENHLINWEESSILAKDSERNTRWIRESIWIRRKGGNNKSTLMNADEGAYQLSHIYDQLIQRASSKKKDDVTVSRPGSAASTVWENILTGCETSLLPK